MSMKHIKYLILLAFIFPFVHCKEQGHSFISLRKITNNTLINNHNGYLRAKAQLDSVLYAGIHYAKILGNIYDISDSLYIKYYGHIWSIDNENPTLLNTSTFTEMEITQNDTNITPDSKAFKFTSELYNLELDTPYYVRSYVIFADEKGNIIDTGYNPNVKVFRTRIPQDVWFKKADFEGMPRSEAVAFVFDGNIYVGLGYDGVSNLNDFWQYNPDSKTWKNIGNLPKARRSAIASVYNDTLIVGTGYSNDGPERDMWRFDKFSNIWQAIDSLPRNAERYNAVAFTLTYQGKQRVFVGLGYRNSPLSDFYYYKSEADTPNNNIGAWKSITSFIGSERSEAVAAVIDNKAIVGLGVGPNNTYLKDFYIFNPTEGVEGSWRYLTEAPIPLGRANAVAFSLEYERNGILHKMFYFGTGRDENDSLYNDLWALDITQGQWLRKSDIREDFMIGAPREGAVGLSFTRAHVDYGTLVRGLVGLGKSKDKMLRDFWEYLP